MRYYKPARSKEIGRGYFSYLTEAVGNLVTFYNENGYDSDLKLYFDLWDIPGYGTGNMFDVAFELQDHDDYKLNIYHNIEDYQSCIHQYNTYFDYGLRIKTEQIINRHYRLNNAVKSLITDRIENYDISKTIGVHYRTTDITLHHPIVDINKIFKTIDDEDFEYIFLATDSKNEYLKFKERYGQKLLFFDKTASNDSRVFFSKKNPQIMIDEHIKELVFSVFTLSQTKKLICTRSNVSTFSILSNSNLDFNILT